MTTTQSRPLTLVVGNDFSPASAFALDEAARVAMRVAGSELHVVQVVEGEASAERTKQVAGQLRTYVEAELKALGVLAGRGVGIHVRCGRPAREIAQLAKDVGADLIVVGVQKGPHLKQLVVGSVAERLLLAAPCPVFVAGPKPATRDDAHEPAIEPPCPDCVKARGASAGRDWWCARHSEHHARAHSYSFHRELPFRTHDSAIEPTGVDTK